MLEEKLSASCRLYNWVVIASILIGWGIVAIIVLQHQAATAIPPTVLNAVVLDVADEELHVAQLVRGGDVSTMRLSEDKQTWHLVYTLSCDDVGVKLMYVRNKENRPVIYETAVIIQDSTGLCGEANDNMP
jgi:hypothetical protein